MTDHNTEINIETIVEDQPHQSKTQMSSFKKFIIAAFFIETLLFIGFMIWFGYCNQNHHCSRSSAKSSHVWFITAMIVYCVTVFCGCFISWDTRFGSK